MRLFVVFATKLAIYSALAVIGVWLILRGGLMRDGLGVLAAAIGAWELVKLTVYAISVVRGQRLGHRS